MTDYLQKTAANENLLLLNNQDAADLLSVLISFDQIN
jgi:hypothetical protein